ncbi:hypothetical protein [Qipengyuania nanhaisediminis]|uniref:Uncharacterized protein n=1 Tax=Qipengyuania nanhaisediminis TaxID=604088 RepID=A0A1I5N5W1_9SPHN|nr:hypothetical protein [Qipengyuania nanhaisediminis]SFP16706.1 hypothetical protein SAMN04488060_1783 [Qipengyuania nanhaisediminis]
MSNSQNATASNVLAKHWARKGREELDMLEATLNLARRLLASGEVQPYVEGENPFEVPPFDWEASEPKADAPRRIWLGTVSDLESGTGHTVYFAAGLARDADEFRRQLASNLGPTLANGAEVSLGLEEFKFSRTFISPPLRQVLTKFDEGKGAPSQFFFLSRWSENSS